MSPALATSTASTTPLRSLTAGAHGLSPLGHSNGSPDMLVYSVWAGYGQQERGSHASLTSGADGWIIPTSHCDASNPSAQYTWLLAWYDWTASDSTPAGIQLYCAAGAHGPAQVYAYSPVSGFYTGVNAGDQVTVYMADYSDACGQPCIVIYLYDWTNGFYILDYSYPSSIAHNAFAGIVDTESGCYTSTGICPQVHFAQIGDGTAYDNVGYSVACAFNPDGSAPAYPCAGYGDVLSSNYYYYPIGTHPAGAVDQKFILSYGDNGAYGSPYYTHTGALLGDDASHTYNFHYA